MEQGYDMDDKIGRSGVEKAFEEYLRGTDGTRVVSTNSRRQGHRRDSIPSSPSPATPWS